MDAAVLAGIIMLITCVFFLILGIPIAISIGFGSFLAMLCVLNFDRAMITSAQQMFRGSDNFPLMAITFFILAGNIMNNGGIAIRLVNCAKVLAGRMPAPLAQTNIIANMLFGALSGSGVAAAAAIGGTLGPIERKEGYEPNFVAAVNTASAPTGMLIPPSNTLIVYSTVATGTSVAALFLAGYLPGILWGLFCMVLVAIIAKRQNIPKAARTNFRTSVSTIVIAIPSLLLIVIVIGGILGGIFTATEASAIAVCYSIILSLIYRNLNLPLMKKILIETAETTVIVTFMIGASMIMSYVMVYTHIPTLITNTILGFTSQPYFILLIMNCLLLVIGCAMDPIPAILIFTPIFLPICKSFGMDPVHFGIMITMNLCIGTITPPVGPILFTGVRIGGVTIESIFKPMLPFFAITVFTLLITTYIPAISMWLPKLTGLVGNYSHIFRVVGI
ncbi:MAG: TRAP transporter large permease [Elusimicrobiota bacterium]|jgi:tripartite ATP-independent transporter DctM subunit|nr:TRAP transporter large permease [Elusimicrobiota bacterium]